jgi:hypothetical protein
MNQSQPTLNQLSPPDMLLVEHRCRQFEKAWQSSRERPRFEEFLTGVADTVRPVLLVELILLELDYRRQHGEIPVLWEFLSRWPGDEAVIRKVFAQAEAKSLPTHMQPHGPVLSVDFEDNRTSFPGYELLEELGRGGMGVVYKARHLGLDRIVALKVVRKGSHSEGLQRFLREAQALAALQHPNVVQVFDSGEHQDLPFCVMEYVEGGSLAQRLNEGPLPAKDAARLVEQIAHGIQAVHEKGIIHRDLKPGNILLQMRFTTENTENTEKKPKVTDFGLAKRIESESGLTHSGAVMGTPSYMAPEQAEGLVHDIGSATDVYGLGAILYECLTGRPPFRAANIFETLVQVRSQEPVAVRHLQPKCPRDLETICHKCLRKEANRRYRTVAALADDLQRFLTGRAIRARPVGLLQRAVKWARRRPTAASLTGLLVALTFSGVIWGWQWHRQQSLADQAVSQAVPRSPRRGSQSRCRCQECLSPVSSGRSRRHRSPGT